MGVEVIGEENGEASSQSRSIWDFVYKLVVIVCVRGELYMTCRDAFSRSRCDCRRVDVGDKAVNGGRGEFRRML